MLDTLGKAVRLAMGQDNPAEAKRLLTVALSSARRERDPGRAIHVIRALAQIEAHLGNEGEVLRLYGEAVAMARKLDDPRVLAHTVRHLGDLHRRAGRYAEAQPHYEEALDIYRRDETTPSGELANAVRPMALLMEALGENEAARTLWGEARVLYGKAGVEAGVEECDVALSRLAGL